MRSGVNQGKREERSFAPQNILCESTSTISTVISKYAKEGGKARHFSCSHDAFRFAARSGESRQSRKRTALGPLYLSSVFSALRAIFKTKGTFHSLTELPAGMACKSDFSPPNISEKFLRRRTLPNLWAQCGQRRYLMSQSEGNEINEWQVQKSAMIRRFISSFIS